MLKKILTLVSFILSMNSFAISVVQTYVPECNFVAKVPNSYPEKIVAAKGYQGGTGKDFCVSKEEFDNCRPTNNDPMESCTFATKREMVCNGVASVYSIDCGPDFKDCCRTPMDKPKISIPKRGRMRK